jgi:hypothetical protein
MEDSDLLASDLQTHNLQTHIGKRSWERTRPQDPLPSQYAPLIPVFMLVKISLSVADIYAELAPS